MTNTARLDPADSTRPQIVDGAKATQGAKRVTVVFAPQTYKKLEHIAALKGITHTEALRQAISIAEYLEKAQSENAKIYVDRAGKLTELVIH